MVNRKGSVGTVNNTCYGCPRNCRSIPD